LRACRWASSTPWQGDAELCQQATGEVDALGACAQPLLADPVQTLQRLLIERFDGDRLQIGVAPCPKQCIGIRRIGFVAPHVGPYVLGVQQAGIMAMGTGGTGPVMGCDTGFHDNLCRRLL